MNNLKISGDQAALYIMLGPGSAKAKQVKLTHLASKMREVVTNTMPCPSCDHTGPHEDNGSTRELTYLCVQCGEQWDAE